MRGPRDLERLRALSGVKWRRWGDEVIPAWVADMDFPTAPAIVDALREMVESSDFGYNFASFDDSIPRAWALWSSDRFGWDPPLDRVRVFSTSLQAIAATLAVCTAPGDGVLLTTPVYSPFFGMIEKSGRRVVEYPLDRTGWRIDRESLRDSIDAGTRAIVLCNPHNPSGRVFDREELEAVLESAEEFDLLVVCDEIWQDLVYLDGPAHIPFASLCPEAMRRTVTVTAASKSFSLGGLSCAVAHLGHPGASAGIEAMVPHVLGGINALGARATLAAWEHGGDWLTDTLSTLQANRDHLLARFAAELPTIRVAAPAATYVAWLDFRDTEIASDPADALLDRACVGLSPGPDFGTAGQGHARLNFATHREILDEIIDRIASAVG